MKNFIKNNANQKHRKPLLVKPVVIGNIFFSNDIVEVLNLSDEQIYSIRSQTCDFNKQPNRDIVGMHYKIKVNIHNYSYDDIIKLNEIHYSLIGWNHGGHFSKFEPTQLRLINRPLKNWLKLIRFVVFGQYCP